MNLKEEVAVNAGVTVLGKNKAGQKVPPAQQSQAPNPQQQGADQDKALAQEKASLDHFKKIKGKYPWLKPEMVKKMAATHMEDKLQKKPFEQIDDIIQHNIISAK